MAIAFCVMHSLGFFEGEIHVIEIRTLNMKHSSYNVVDRTDVTNTTIVT